ncbi:MAG: 50S ribosomal protein L32 [Minisyncoccales bacterium]
MAVPKQRKTKSRQKQRRMHYFIKGPVLSLCPKCHQPIRPHTVCFNCGYYKGKEVIDVFKKLTKKERKKKEKELKAKKVEEKEKPLTMEELSKK